MLLYPEGMVKLNQSAAAILTRCNGRRTVADIVTDLESTYSLAGLTQDNCAFIALAIERTWLELRSLSDPMLTPAAQRGNDSARPGPPLWLLLELTYRCPLHCVFCYNPTEFESVGPELETADWLRVLAEARELGSVQLGLSGGEPLVRDDLETIVAAAHRLGFYTNLITSGVGLTEPRLQALREGGLDHIQLSFQDSTRVMNDFLSSTRTFELKSRVAALIKKYHYPMVLNVVLHRLNIDHVEEILGMAERMGADYVELANTQYYGWAWRNRDELLPTRAQLRRAEDVTARFRERVGARMPVFFVVPDYFETRPKPCMSGLGRVFLGIAPDGVALPCQAARMLPGLAFPNVREASVGSIWYDSPAFNPRYRGEEWMKEPCRTCLGSARATLRRLPLPGLPSHG